MKTAALVSIVLAALLTGCAGGEQQKARPISFSRPPVSSPPPEKVWEAPPVISPAERMKTYPVPGEYVAFSLKAAQKIIQGLSAGENYRCERPEVYQLGGINQLHGFVIDRETTDVILVGKYDPQRQPLTLDDLDVALKSRFIHKQWPLVSVDPTEETERTEMQKIRFEGGIENTQFGADLLDADYNRLKRIGFGLLPSGVLSFKTHWDLWKEFYSGVCSINSRFWFFPVLPSVSIREDVVAIRGLKIGVFTEVLSAEIEGEKVEDLSDFRDKAGDQFARNLSDNFESLAKIHPSFSRVQNLLEATAFVKALEEMEANLDLSFWLRSYSVKPVPTPKQLEVLRRREEYPLGNFLTGYRQLSGGIQLTALPLRVRSGDVTALKKAVLGTRPNPKTLCWTFMVGEWIIPGEVGMEDVIPLFTQALFLEEKDRPDDAIVLLTKIISLKPNWALPYFMRGDLKADQGLREEAIADYNQALTIGPKDAGIYYNRGVTYAEMDRLDEAIADFDRVIAIDPWDADAYCSRGRAKKKKGLVDQAIADYLKAKEVSPRYPLPYNRLGVVYAETGHLDQAIACFNEALEIDSEYDPAYHNLGNAYTEQGLFAKAIDYFNQALAINPKYADSYYDKALACEKAGRMREASEAYKVFLRQAKPEQAEKVEKAKQRIQEIGGR